MAMNVSGSSGGVKGDINITPLVEVVLVLLIIFMVVVPMMDKSPSVTLPDIFNPDEEAKGKTDPFTLSVTPFGNSADTSKTTRTDALGSEQRSETISSASCTRRILAVAAGISALP